MEDNGLITLTETSGLENAKKNEIVESLQTFFNKANEWNATIDSIVITKPEEIGKMKMAREGRLTLRSMRLEAETIVKTKRDAVKGAMLNYTLEDKLWLKAGQMIEATFKNLETRLEEKEKFAERWEAEQKARLKAERLSDLLPLGFDAFSTIDLGSIDEQTFKTLKVGLEIAKKERDDAIAREEADRIAKAKAEAEEVARIKAENDKLKAKIEADNILAEKARIEADRMKADLEARDVAEKALKAKIEADNILAEKARIEADRMKADLEARDVAEKALKAKIEADNILAEKASDNTKLRVLIDKINDLEMPKVNDEEAIKVVSTVKILLSDITTYILANID